MRPRVRRWTRETALAAFKALAQQLGHTPSLREVRTTTERCPSDRSLIRLFGSWRAAVLAAGFTPRKRGGPVGRRVAVCRWGHSKIGNSNAQGHCLTCAKRWGQNRKAPRKPPALRLVPIDPAKAEAITQQKQAFWREVANGKRGLNWTHPYARRSA